MTLNEKALEAAASALCDASLETHRYEYSCLSQDVGQSMMDVARILAKAAIEAWEAALWRPIEELADGKIVIMYALMDTETGNWKMATGCKHNGEFTWDGDRLREWSILPTHWRPIPTFKEQK